MERKKVLALLTAVGVLLSTAGCSKKEAKLDESGVPLRESLTKIHNEIDHSNPIKNYYQSVYENNRAVVKYKASVIHFLFNKNTYEVMTIIQTGISQEDDTYRYKVYLVEDNNLELIALYYNNLILDDTGENVDYWKYLKNESYDIKLTDAAKYIGEDFKMKSNYTYNELVELGEKIVIGLKAVKEEEKKVNVK